MILLNNFFSINDQVSSETEIWAELFIDAGHKIFEGHFPGQPVVPGVCMMQMIKEIYEVITGNTTDLIEAAELKFLAIINPIENNLVNASINITNDDIGRIKIAASIFKDDVVHFKCKALLQVLGH